MQHKRTLDITYSTWTSRQAQMLKKDRDDIRAIDSFRVNICTLQLSRPPDCAVAFVDFNVAHTVQALLYFILSDEQTMTEFLARPSTAFQISAH